MRDAVIRAALICEVCGKALGRRRAAQGLTKHPGCRRMLRPAELAAALERTREVLKRVTLQTDDDELDPLLVEAAEQAREVMKDLQRMKDYVNAPSVPARSGRSGQESPTA